jgi:hypothetical protein
MPVIKRKPPETPGREELVEQLVGELRAPGEKGQPLILQYPIGDTEEFNVYVIWDRWAGVSHTVRTRIILDAYRRFDETSEQKIPIASGITTAEAILEGLLPVKIVCLVPFALMDDEIRKAMIEEGAIETTGGLQLRFPTLEDGKATFQRLETQFPGNFGFIEERFVSAD